MSTFDKFLMDNNIVSLGAIEHAKEYMESNNRLVDELRSLPECLVLLGETSDSTIVRAYNLYQGSNKMITTEGYAPNSNYSKVLTMGEQVEMGIMVLRIDEVSKKITLGCATNKEVTMSRAQSVASKRVPGFEIECLKIHYTSFYRCMETLHNLNESRFDNHKINVSVEERLHTVFRNALELSATDISFEPYAKGMEIWYAIGKNWFLYPHILFPLPETENVSNWIVTAADVASGASYQSLVNCALKSLGRITTHRGRVNKFDAYYGEVLNIRVLPNEPEFINIDKLNYTDVMTRYLKDIAKWREGIVLFTGETNSGKNTSIFGLLTQIITKQRYKTLSLENPIEYLVPAVIQIEADNPSTYTSFSESLLRQSPDIIYYSEISTPSIAENVMSTAITGKFVVSTLHSSSSSQIFNRMGDMVGYDVTSKLSSYLIGVINQKLLPKSCPTCREEVDIKNIDDRYAEVLFDHNYLDNVFINTGKINDSVCPTCKGLGVKGIVPVAEYVDFTPELKKKLRIATNALEVQTLLEDEMKSKGITMLDDALRLMQRGDVSITTLIDRSVLDIKTRGIR